MKTRDLVIVTITAILVISSFTLPDVSAEQKQFQVNTKMEFPESLPLGKTTDFKIHVTNKGPYSWVKNLEPTFEIIPTRAQQHVEIKTEESFSQYTVWKGHINTLQGTIHISEDSPFDAIFLSVSFDGTIRFDEEVTSVDPDSAVSLKVGESQPDIKGKPTFHEGYVEWMSRCNMVGSDITVRVIDPDMNNDPQRIEELKVTIWSDNDGREVTYVATETGSDTGIFDAKVFFTTTDSSPGNRIRAIDNSIIHAKYVDYTFSDSYKATDVIDTIVMSGLDILEKDSRGIPTKITYDPCAMVLLEKNQKEFNELDVFYPTPLKQIESGLYVDEVLCKDNLVLILKHDGTPACVKPETSAKLVGRGWTAPVNEWSSFTPITPELGKFGTYKLEKGGVKFDIKYYIKGGSDIKEIIPDSKYNAVSIILEPHDSGSLEITIPRELIDSKMTENADDLFFVLIDKKEVPHTETVSDLTRTLTIKFDKNSQEIEIIGAMPI